MEPIVKRIGMVVKPDAEAIAKADELEVWLKDRQVDVLRKNYAQPSFEAERSDERSAPGDLVCVIVLGGDGTFLGAARWIGDQKIPLLGVKFGEVGFLAEAVEENLFSMAEDILQNRYTTEMRMRLEVTVMRDGAGIAQETVLNDIVINKGALARLAHIDTYIDDKKLTTYKSDGLIVATPTGSTAYSLAAGGPIIHPAVSGIIMTPICPFTLTNRPLIIPDSAGIKLRIAKQSADIMLTFDGQEGLPIDHLDTIQVRRSPHPIYVITVPGQQYYDVLKAKLKWSGSRI